ncbi:ATP-dependent DNA helicase RecQ [Verrucomicrobium sp. GAS474]|uniref:DNA helicase RecQ n=1 Tax=Verrucomicrobium sp. GAS474 TaxID=1882831 RepID=UPI00087A9AE5|nr:DNA helicase RecQ [Verrucomicrobium sp. GAS474]SDT93533.1 ATP-dependent DNA helicase RecQ [Verrucomicrobium sp. GAS474]
MSSAASIAPTPHTILKEVFGYDTFRPLQEEIVGEILAGRDAFALLPTGGGKSLCFQLPALLLPGLTVVISPLIALMKDQVDSLVASGVAATYLNSTLDGDEARARFRALHKGEVKLLYIAPERLVLPGMLENLAEWNVSLLAVDEAHCISEWGHDFRPEYRRIAELRDRFPGVPVLALTATATERVRADISRQLRLDGARHFVASFNRPNLTYRVSPKAGAYATLLRFLAGRRGEAGIIYCQSRKATEEVAGKLEKDGISAVPYHAGLNPATRAKNQELFLRDEVRVVCATIAFGMGINKPNVRFVVHYDLPKNVEGYYQETGRAGRDGLPAECLLLFSAGDAIKQRNFIDEKTDPDERKAAHAQLRQMIDYAEDDGCRRRALLGYFAEKWEGECQACDNCNEPRESYDATVPAQKFLSTVFRVRQSGGFGVGLTHLAEILTGGKGEKLLRWGHDQLSTYGIGKDLPRAEWQEIGRQLIRAGFARQTEGEISVVELTEAGRTVLRDRTPIRLVKPVAASARAMAEKEGRAPRAASAAGAIACDEQLFQRLRTLRKELADQRNVPAYVIFSDVTLRLMARDLPFSLEEIGQIGGVGQKKLAEFGEAFLESIRTYRND